MTLPMPATDAAARPVPRARVALLLTLLAACAGPRAVTPDGPVTLLPDPGADTGWSAATTSGRDRVHATWTGTADGGLELTDAAGHTDQEFNVTWSPAVALADVDLTVRLQAVDGDEDRGGGPVWRLTGPDDYYVARWNPLENNLRAYVVEDGYRRELASATVYVSPRAWHELRVRMVGESITCWLDGHEQLSVRDDDLAGPGAVGLWTKADARTRFTDLVVGPADETPPGVTAQRAPRSSSRARPMASPIRR